MILMLNQTIKIILNEMIGEVKVQLTQLLKSTYNINLQPAENIFK